MAQEVKQITDEELVLAKILRIPFYIFTFIIFFTFIFFKCYSPLSLYIYKISQSQCPSFFDTRSYV